MSHLFFETNLGKNILTPNNKLFPQKKKKKKKLLQSYTPCLHSQSVKNQIELLMGPVTGLV